MSTEGLVGLIAAATAVLTALVKFVRPARQLWEMLAGIARKIDTDVETADDLKKSLREMRRVAALKAVLSEWVVRKGAQRALLLVANNGGDAWRGSGPLYCSNPAQVVGPGEPNTIDLWQQWKVDAAYQDFLGRLLQVYERHRGLLLVAKNDVEGELKAQYGRQGTHASVVFPFKWSEGGVLWYVSLNFGAALHTDSEGKPLPATAEEEAAAIRSARAIYSDEARCRMLIQQLQQAFDSIR